ncbi:pentatricopeptide repeat-containing protein At5g15280, mitochondrial-like isoform X2 [Vicia villosa]|uniref:pentatricopeptide repeat-containing protein At5g15280, mitochondrial-like isoform X2 n=1 Tax=Vicia villosa TaxID=3911 RepID=UPI00273C4990|nr:pentatricopeptide repeat-containing protein At5g15280, mitochondrial-like isoform X2 [Vicia villosa]
MLNSLTTLRRHSPNLLSSLHHLTTKTTTIPSLSINSHLNPSLKPHLLELSTVIPDITRQFWRVPVLKTQHVLQILLGFQSECSKVGICVEKVRSLYEIFKWGVEKNNTHFLQSYEVMSLLLVHAGLFTEAENLITSLEGKGVSLGGVSSGIFDKLIEGYVSEKQLEKAVFVYEKMKEGRMVPSRLSYRVLLDYLVKMKRTQTAFRVAFDLVELGESLCGDEMRNVEDAMVLLCVEGKIQEARSLIRKVLRLENYEVSSLVFDEIAFGYCEKKDFKDLISFFVEVNCIPSVIAGNRVMNSMCKSYDVERASLFLKELESVGFCPNEATYGMLIGWSCYEGKMKNALSYLSVMLSKSFVPRLCTYNALISGLFKVGMLENAKDILDEMIDRGMVPDISTFRVLIAGYCKSRRFDKVKSLVREMESRGLVNLSSTESPLSKAFQILGLNPLNVRLKRDNNKKLFKAEFFDEMGNGLYLDTNVDEFENHVNSVLGESVLPDFNSSVMKECSSNNIKIALVLVEEMLCWGQELLLPEYSKLVRQLCSSRSQITSVIKLLEKMPRSARKLDHETLNLVVQAYIKKGLLCRAKSLLDEMLQNKFHIENSTYTSLLVPLCKKGNMKDFNYYWNIACRNKWLPKLEEFKHLLGHICHQKMLPEALQFLEIMLLAYPLQRLDIYHTFLKVLSSEGLTDTALVILKQLQFYSFFDQASYNNLIRGLCNERKFSLAFTILDDMLQRNFAPCLDVSVLLIPQLCKARRYDKAIALKDIILKEQPSVSHSADCALICGFCYSGNIEKADSLFRDLLSKGLILDDELCNMLIQGHCKTNDLRIVGELLGVAIRKSMELSLLSYKNLVRSMCMKGRVPVALSLKNFMFARCSLDDVIGYNILIFYLLSSGNRSVVDKILTEMEEKKVILDEVGQNNLVYGFLQCKDLSGSLHYLTSMILTGLKPSSRSLRKVISSLCDVGEVQKAVELSREMGLRGWIHDSIIQTRIVENLLSHGLVKEAESFLDRMEEESLTPDNINYDYLIKRFCQYGRLKKAVHLLNTMLKKSNIPISTSYDFLIHGLCAQNELDIASNFYSEMQNWNLKPRIDTVERLVFSFCEHGRTEQAEQFLVDMIRGGETPTRKMYCAVIKNYHAEKNLKKASELVQAMQEKGYQPEFDIHWSLISNLSNAKEKDAYDVVRCGVNVFVKVVARIGEVSKSLNGGCALLHSLNGGGSRGKRQRHREDVVHPLKKEHLKFRRRGGNLIVEHTLSLTGALCLP